MLQRHSLTPESIGLLTADLERAGWSRRRQGRGWRYMDQKGDLLSGSDRTYCEALAIPPAWQSVWISPIPKTHILSFGEDQAGRRQYIYHTEWRAARERAKFSDLPRFAEGLPRLRRSLKKMLTSDDPDTLAVASVVRLLDQGGLRVGHIRPHEDDPAIGATTLQPEHVNVGDDRIDLSYRAKGGKERDVSIADATLADAIDRLIALSDDDEDYVFETESGRCSASRVNDFLHDRLGARFSAKDFRTWGGSVAAARVLRKTDQPTIKMISEAAAEWLGNTPTIARNSYIHPAIIEAREHDLSTLEPSGPTRLRADERFCYAVITA